MRQTAGALLAAWLVLVGLTALSLTAAEAGSLGGDVLILLVMTAAVVKGAFVLVRFMGALSFPAAWRGFFLLWLLGCAGVIVVLHLLAHG